MIEIEVRVKTDDVPKIDSLEFTGEKRIIDIYYDTLNYDFIKSGNFLRNRNNKKIDFKLNIDGNDPRHIFCNETSFDYEKFAHNKSVETIFKNIKINYNKNFKNFEEFLTANKLIVLCKIDKTRKAYNFDGLKLSVDDAKELGTFIELEKNIDDKSDIDKAKASADLLKKLTQGGIVSNFNVVKIGYVEMYLKKYNPKVYKMGLYH